MQYFCLITNKYKDPELTITREIMAYIRKKGGQVINLVSVYHEDGVEDFDPDEIPKNTEIILVLGGDGTLIRAATRVQHRQIPLIGVNLGTLGYLCELSLHEVWYAIDNLMEDRYLIEDRIMLCGGKENDSKRKLALNDVVIHHGGSIAVLKLNIYINGKYLVQYKADGIIVATPTGSTGYSMSAGGPIVDPKGEMLLLTPNNAHAIGSKSLVLTGEDEITIEVDPDNNKHTRIYVSFDGDRTEQLVNGDRFVISRASNRVHICKLSQKSFLEILSRKMGSQL